MMNSDYLSALALLKVAYDERGSTYVDYVVPFVGDTIRAACADSITTPELKAALLERYGLDLPDGVINTLTRRLARGGYGGRHHGAFVPARDRLQQDFDFEERRAQTQQSISMLAASFVRFVQAELDRTLTEAEASAALTAYTQRNGLPILQRALRDEALVTSLSLDDLEYLASRYVVHVFEGELAERDTLVVLAKGSKLASVLYLPNPSEVGRRFDELVALFDTPALLSALGYQGKEAEVAAREVLDLAYANGIHLGVLEGTVHEVESVLDAVGNKVGRHGFSGRQLRGVEAHFLSVGYNASDIKLLAAHLEEDLQSLRIRIVAKPPMRVELSVNETALEACLLEHVRYPRREPMLHDLEALTATWRLRNGRLPNNLESSRAVFVSPNVPLVRSGHDFFRSEYGDHWPLGITDDDFATLLWLKRPLAAPDLPAHRLLADAYAALEPGMVNWAGYLDEIDRLKSRGEVSEEQYFFLRYSSEARQALMEESLGAGDGVTAETIHRVVDRVRDDLTKADREKATRLEAELASAMDADRSAQEKLRRELADAQASQQAARSVAAAAQSEVARIVDAQRRGARRRSERIARWVRGAVIVLSIAVLAVGLWFSAPAAWELPPRDPPALVRWGARGTVAALLLFTLGNLIFGWQANQAARRVELWLARRLEHRFLADAGLDGDEADWPSRARLTSGSA